MSTINLLSNPNFGAGWIDLLPYGGRLTNQCPYGFNIEIRLPGKRLISADGYDGPDDAPVYDTVAVVPECVHKVRSQLPDADDLILEGVAVYKIFSATNPFSFTIMAEARMPASGTLDIVTPVQVHQHGDGSPGAAVWRQLIDAGVWEREGEWRTFGDGFTDREYAFGDFSTRVVAGEVIVVTVQMESRALGGIDFFTDAWRFDFTPDDQPPIPEPEPCPRPRAEWTDRTTVLVRADAPDDIWLAACKWANDPTRRHSIDKSWDHAVYAPWLERVTVLLWQDHKDAIPIEGFAYWADTWYDTANLTVYEHIAYTEPGPEPDPPPDPEPDPPPDPAWKPHNYVPTGTLLGFHAAGDGGQTGDVFAPLTPLGAQPPTSKVIVSLGAARDIKAIDPSVITIGRIIDAPGYGNVEGFDYGGDPEAQAHWHMAAIMQQFGPHLEWYDYIEVINEQGPPTPAYHVKLAQFFLHCMTIANTWGMKLALFSHSVGTPEPADWDAIADTGIFEAAARWGHCIALHEYNLSSTGGCLYRYRDLYNRIILPKQLDIPLYITEYNVDVAFAFNADVMFANWTAYDTELARDPYVAGVHIYSTGEVYSSYRPTIYSLWDRYRGYAISVKDRINA